MAKQQSEPARHGLSQVVQTITLAVEAADCCFGDEGALWAQAGVPEGLGQMDQLDSMSCLSSAQNALGGTLAF